MEGRSEAVIRIVVNGVGAGAGFAKMRQENEVRRIIVGRLAIVYILKFVLRRLCNEVEFIKWLLMQDS